jgi:hypothetical protein
MTQLSIRALALVALFGAQPALGAEPPAGTPVSGVVVVGGPGPKLTETFPADGAAIPAGVLVVKVVFDQPMTPNGWSYGPSPDGTFPNCLGQPRLLADQRTFDLLCTVSPHQSYVLQINAAPDFESRQGRAAKPALLHFSTNDQFVSDVHDALDQAGLTDTDEPIMDWKGVGAGAAGAANGAVPAP